MGSELVTRGERLAPPRRPKIGTKSTEIAFNKLALLLPFSAGLNAGQKWVNSDPGREPVTRFDEPKGPPRTFGLCTAAVAAFRRSKADVHEPDLSSLQISDRNHRRRSKTFLNETRTVTYLRHHRRHCSGGYFGEPKLPSASASHSLSLPRSGFDPRQCRTTQKLPLWPSDFLASDLNDPPLDRGEPEIFYSCRGELRTHRRDSVLEPPAAVDGGDRNGCGGSGQDDGGNLVDVRVANDGGFGEMCGLVLGEWFGLNGGAVELVDARGFEWGVLEVGRAWEGQLAQLAYSRESWWLTLPEAEGC
ncbi:hypothetical protein GQ457_10G008670 [Hibiscus cannabinus]